MEEEKMKRKEKRNALREENRLDKLKENILKSVIQTATFEDFAPKHKVYDLRDPLSSNDGIIIIGGFVGEIIITFTCLLDFICSNPNHQNFTFTADMLLKNKEKFIKFFDEEKYKITDWTGYRWFNRGHFHLYGNETKKCLINTHGVEISPSGDM